MVYKVSLYIITQKNRGCNWILPVAPLRRRYSLVFIQDVSW